MKKIFLALVALVLLLLSACGGSPIKQAQRKAVDVGEQFLSYKITTEEAVEQLSSIKVPETEGNGQLYLQTDIDYLAFIIGLDMGGGATYEEIKEKVESIRSRDYTND